MFQRRKRRPTLDPQADAQRAAEREISRRERRERRRERRARLAMLAANMLGAAFGTKNVGGAIIAVVIIAGAVFVWKFAL